MRWPVITALGVILPILSCTVGLGDASSERCTVTSRQADDVCNRLNADPKGCQPWQCDAVTSRCVERARDDDRDGDPSIACGGHDCNDEAPTISSRSPEVCDGLDNDCNGLVDDGLYDGDLPVVLSTEVGGPLSSTSEARVSIGDGLADAVGAFRKVRSDASGCLGVIGTTGSHDRCDLGDPHEPFGIHLGSGLGVAYVDLSDSSARCLRYLPSDGSAAIGDCARLPSLVSLDDDSAMLFGFGGRDLPDGCSSTHTLVYAPITGAAGSAPAIGTQVPIASAMRAAIPPATAVVATPVGPRVLLAAAGADVVGLWSVDANGRARPTGTIAVPGVRAVSLAVGVRDGFSIALAVENGCGAGAATVELWLGAVSAALDAITTPFRRVSDGVAGGSPSVAWSTSSSEWRFAWLETGQVARGRRFTESGAPIGEPIFLAADVVDARLDQTTALITLDTTSLSDVALRCR